MNKTQLIDAVAEKAELSKGDARKAVDAFIEAVGDALKDANDGKVAILGFGTFSVSERGEKVVKFKAGCELENKL